MARYKKYSREQSVFIPVCFEDQIIPGTFVHAIDHLVENELDLSIFDKHFNNDKTGATAYSPSVLLKIVLYAYSLGIVSSRKIAWCCETNITFMALSKEAVFTADTGFHSKEALEFIEDNEIDAYIPDNQFRQRDPRFDTADRHKKPVDRKGTVKKAKYFKAQEFTRDGENENLICPEGKALRIRCRNYKNKKGHIGITYVSDKEDCCCCPQKGKCIRGKKAKVRQVTIIENTMRKTDSPVRRMMEKVDSPDGKFLYSRRMGAIEPVFANIRNCLGLDRFTLRGQIKVDIQWKLFNMVHNIGKLSRFAWS